MANVIEVLIKGLVSDDFKKALDQASQSVEGFANKVSQAVESANKRFEGMNKGFDSLGKAMIGIGAALSIGITAPTVALANGAVQAGANIEKLTVAFQPLLGSAQAAAARMGELQKFANLTPFELPEVAKASRMLEVMTKGVLATGDALRMVGDVASGVGQNFDEVAMWVGRLYDGLKSGRPVGEATMRLQEMGAMSGDTRNKLEQMAASGAKFSEVWAVATEAFGRFAGGMELQANTVEGKISTLHDSAQTALANLGRSFEGVTKNILDLATSITDKLAALADWFGKLPEPVKYVTLAVVALAAVIGPLLVAFGGILLAIPGLIAGWAALVPIVTAATAAIAAGALSIAAYTIVIGLIVGGLTLLVIAIKDGVEWWHAYQEASQKAADVDRATDEALARRAVGLEHRQALRKAGIDVAAGPQETSQSQQGGSYAAFQQQQAAAQASSNEAAAKVHAEFIKTDRAALIGAETKKYEEQKKALGDNAEGLKELNALHKQALEDIDKKTIPKAKADPEAKAARDLAISQAQDRFKVEQDTAAKILTVRRETVLASISDERQRDLEALAQRTDREMAAANGNKALLLALHDQARADRAAINKKWDEKEAQEAIKLEKTNLETAKKNQEIARAAFEEVKKTTFTGAWFAEVDQRMKTLGTGVQQVARTMSSVFDSAMGSLGNNLTAVLTRTKSLTQGMKDLGREILSSVVGGIVSAALKWVQMEVMKATMSKAMAAASLAVTAPIAAAQSALWTAPATFATIATFGGAAAMAPGEIAASLAMTKALASFEVGTPRVPHDMLAQIHSGEGIIPKNFMDGIRSGELSLGGPSAGGSGSHSLALVAGPDIIRALKTEGRALVQITDNQKAVSFA